MSAWGKIKHAAQHATHEVNSGLHNISGGKVGLNDFKSMSTIGLNDIGNKLSKGWKDLTGQTAAHKAAKAAKKNAKRLQDAGLAQAEAMRHQADVMQNIGNRQMNIGQQQMDLNKQIAANRQDLAQKQLNLTQQSINQRKDIAQNQLDLGQNMADIAQKRADIGQQALDFGQQRWQDYRDLYRPTEKAMLDMANQGPNYDRAVSQAMADVAAAQGNNLDQNARMLSRYGMNPNSGRFATAAENRAMTQAAQEAQARTQARRKEKADSFNFKTTALGRGQYLPGMAQQGFSQAQAGLGGATSSYGGAGNLNSSAGQLEAGLGNAYAGAGNQWSGMNNLYSGASGIYGNAGSAIQGAGSLQQGALSGLTSAQGAFQNIYNTAEKARQFNTTAALKEFNGLLKGAGQAAGYSGMAEGGEVDTQAMGGRTFNNGGELIQGPGGPKSDSIPGQAVDAQGNSKPVALSNGEYVLPTEAVKYYGLDKLDKMVQKAQEAMQGRVH